MSGHEICGSQFQVIARQIRIVPERATNNYGRFRTVSDWEDITLNC